MIVCRQFREGAVDPRVAARPLSSCLLRSQSEPLDVIILPAAGRENERLDGAGRGRAHYSAGQGQPRATLCMAQAMRLPYIPLSGLIRTLDPTGIASCRSSVL